MPLVLGGSAVVTPPYSIDNSCRFNAASSAYMSKTFGTPTTQNKWTLSAWVKRGDLTYNQDIFAVPVGTSGGYFHTGLQWNGSNQLECNVNYTGSVQSKLMPSALFRDISAWYHLVTVYDSAATEADRVILYINGTRATGPWGTETFPSLNFASQINQALEHRVGDGANGDVDGYIAEMVFCDGQAYAASDFGEFDSASPTVWKPKDPSELTFGDNGFWLDFGDSADLGADVSGNSNDFALTNLAAIDQTTDTPTNNFATANPLMSNAEGFAEGNLYVTDRASTDASYGACSSMGVRKGKWYMEMYMVSTGSTINLGAMPETSSMTTAGDYQYQTNNFQYRSTDGNAFLGTGSTDDGGGSYGATYTTGDIISIALDMDNQDIYFYKNGTIQDSGTAAFTSSDFVDDTFYFFYQAGYNTGIVEYNFGNPIRTISSGNADANGYGNFEYAVPSGYYALCSKNLGEFGG